MGLLILQVVKSFGESFLCTQLCRIIADGRHWIGFSYLSNVQCSLYTRRTYGWHTTYRYIIVNNKCIYNKSDQQNNKICSMKYNSQYTKQMKLYFNCSVTFVSKNKKKKNSFFLQLFHCFLIAVSCSQLFHVLPVMMPTRWTFLLSVFVDTTGSVIFLFLHFLVQLI